MIWLPILLELCDLYCHVALSDVHITSATIRLPSISSATTAIVSSLLLDVSDITM